MGENNDDDVRNHNKTITAKIETLYGKVHPAQTASVYRALSQDGLGPCLDAFRSHGIRPRHAIVGAIYIGTSFQIENKRGADRLKAIQQKRENFWFNPDYKR